MIHFWRYKAIARELATNSISERSKFTYLIYYILITTLSLLLPTLLAGTENPGIDTHTSPYMYVAYYAYIIPLIIVGYRYCFALNLKIDGLHFIERVICLSGAINLRALLLQVFLTVLTILSLVVYWLPKAQKLMARARETCATCDQNTINEMAQRDFLAYVSQNYNILMWPISFAVGTIVTLYFFMASVKGLKELKKHTQAPSS